jgi:hypothetical protein
MLLLLSFSACPNQAVFNSKAEFDVDDQDQDDDDDDEDDEDDEQDKGQDNVHDMLWVLLFVPGRVLRIASCENEQHVHMLEDRSMDAGEPTSESGWWW